MPTPEQATIAENLRVLKARRRVSDATIAAGTGLTPSAVNDRLNCRARVQAHERPGSRPSSASPSSSLLAPSTTEAVS
ncbi:hypothetical protein G5V59_26770 [Nocardioides sp. W3-2-3]|uniref:hypothetical protein n=1 Tax=Nocardioides convexus TaxID=2712224 RepID=UPI0024181E0C|nr:hypothetical protein [Nocardioides convexus]NHA01997.1 hypothetical protein [Nocardioides convexus]